MPISRKMKDKVRELEGIIDQLANENVNLQIQLMDQGVEVQTVARAAMEVRGEDVQQLVNYKDTNTRLIEFVEKIAATKSKFATEARELLGI